MSKQKSVNASTPATGCAPQLRLHKNSGGVVIGLADHIGPFLLVPWRARQKRHSREMLEDLETIIRLCAAHNDEAENSELSEPPTKKP